MDEFSSLFADLKKHLKSLGQHFIKKYTAKRNPQTLAAKYEHDVMAYCVLCHAAFEEYFETVALTIADKSIDDWRSKKTVSQALLMLTCYTGEKLKIDDDEKSKEVTVFDSIRKILDDSKQKFSNAINENHGISKKYLRRMMIPVGIDIKRDPSLLNSLQQLAKSRGDYAHKSSPSKIKTIIAPEDAESYVSDCLLLCEDIRDKAKKNLGL